MIPKIPKTLFSCFIIWSVSHFSACADANFYATSPGDGQFAAFSQNGYFAAISETSTHTELLISDLKKGTIKRINCDKNARLAVVFDQRVLVSDHGGNATLFTLAGEEVGVRKLPTKGTIQYGVKISESGIIVFMEVVFEPQSKAFVANLLTCEFASESVNVLSRIRLKQCGGSLSMYKKHVYVSDDGQTECFSIKQLTGK